MTRSFKIAALMTVTATVWVLSGSLSSQTAEAPQKESAAQQRASEPALFRVQVTESQAQTVARHVQLQGEVDAARSVEIRAETSGRIAGLGKAKGERLAEGERIAHIAENDRPARLEKAKATLALRKADQAAGLKLRERNMLSDLQHQQNKAAVVAAQAEVRAIEIELEQTAVSAPFGGLLSARHVEVGDHVSVGDAIATLVDDASALIKAQVPQHHIGELSLGQRVTATLLDGSIIEGQISYIANMANPATRTFAMEARVEDSRGLRHFGQSARVEIALGDTAAHLLSPAVLDLDSDGKLQVKTVNEAGEVASHTVKLLRNETDGVWLTGLPDSSRVITVGQGFVRAGERVTVVAANAPTEATAQ